MTTSPSWFDQQKFSSQVKKIGVKSSGRLPLPPKTPSTSSAPSPKEPVLRFDPAVRLRSRHELKTSPLPDVGAEGASAVQAELSRVSRERDDARREYAHLREEFETLKQENGRLQDGAASSGGGANSEEWEGEKAALLEQAAQRDQENNDLQMTIIGMQDVIETFKQELNALQEQVSQAQEEAEQARQDLEASRKELQEVRDSSREKEASSSMNNTTLENLKRECSTLVQQNMLLQAQHDHLSRELSAAKAKAASKG